jgi:hypothetical protein
MVAGDQVLLAAGDRQAGRLEITVIQLKPDR